MNLLESLESHVLTPVLFSVSCLCSERPSPDPTPWSSFLVKSIQYWLLTCIRYLRQATSQEVLSTSSQDRETTSQNTWQNIKMLMPCGILVQQRDQNLWSTRVQS